MFLAICRLAPITPDSPFRHSPLRHLRFFWSFASFAFEFSINVFTQFAEFIDKNNIILKKSVVLEPTISCVRDRDSTIVPQRHRIINTSSNISHGHHCQFCVLVTTPTSYVKEIHRIIEFFTLSRHYRNAKIANFVSVLPIKISYSKEVRSLGMQSSRTPSFPISYLLVSVATNKKETCKCMGIQT